MKYDVELRFNPRKGDKQAIARRVEAESVGDALEVAIEKISRDIPRLYGGGICVTGVTVNEVRK